MLSSRSVSIALVAAVALVGAFLFLRAEERAGGNIQITVHEETVKAPGFIRGVASVHPEGTVEVTAELDGLHLEGSPDLEMEGPVNEFEFHVTEAMRGKVVTVTATAADGTTVKRVIHIT